MRGQGKSRGRRAAMRLGGEGAWAGRDAMIWGRARRARKAEAEARRRRAESLYARILDQARNPT
ncbi:MAG: hypothetical protein ACTSRY_04535, partial [Alphaproteobacteria bacterium]